MTQTPDPDRPDEQGPPSGGRPDPGGYQPGGYQPGGYQPNYQPGYPTPNYNPYAGQVSAPYGFDPKTGLPYSDKSKLIAGLLQVLIPLGIGRMYIGQTGMGVAQLLVTVLTCGVGAVWPFIDGILILVGDQRDAEGRPLRS